MENTPNIETERLLLRRFTKEDVSALFLLLSDRVVNTYLPMFVLKSEKEAEEYLQKNYLQRYEEAFGYRYAICKKQENIPIGYVHVSGPDSYDLGYALRREYWNQGIVTEAAKAVVQRLKEDAVPYLTATHDINNPASGQVMKHIGMHYQYSYEENWQPKNKLVTFRMYQLNLDGQEKRVYQKYWERYPVHFVETQLH